jgi:hypothetical protein
MSESMDRRLSWRQRLCLRLHLIMCRVCPAVRRQLLLLREAARRHGIDPLGDAGPRLSDEARERIRRLLSAADGR